MNDIIGKQGGLNFVHTSDTLVPQSVMSLSIQLFNKYSNKTYLL